MEWSGVRGRGERRGQVSHRGELLELADLLLEFNRLRVACGRDPRGSGQLLISHQNPFNFIGHRIEMFGQMSPFITTDDRNLLHILPGLERVDRNG